MRRYVRRLESLLRTEFAGWLPLVDYVLCYPCLSNECQDTGKPFSQMCVVVHTTLLASTVYLLWLGKSVRWAAIKPTGMGNGNESRPVGDAATSRAYNDASVFAVTLFGGHNTLRQYNFGNLV